LSRDRQKIEWPLAHWFYEAVNWGLNLKMALINL